MDIGKFIDDYVKAKSQQVKDALVRKHVVATYIPYETKMAEAKNIIKNSCYKKIDDKEYFYIDTPLRFVLLIKSVVTLYTDLEFDQTNILVQFNLLEQYGITEAIINAIGEDYDSFRTIVNMTLDDTMQNERSLVSYLENLGQSFSVAMDELVKKLTEAAEKEME